MGDICKIRIFATNARTNNVHERKRDCLQTDPMNGASNVASLINGNEIHEYANDDRATEPQAHDITAQS